MFRHALEVGKRARTETGISRNIASVSTAAVAMAAERLGSLEGRAILVLGAGEMGEGMVRSLVTAGVVDVRIANRTWERAVELADRPRRPGRPPGRPRRVAGRDRPAAHLDGRVVADARARRPGPRDGGARRPPAADRRRGRAPRRRSRRPATSTGVTLLDMDDLRAFAAAGMAERRREVAAVRRDGRRRGRPLHRREHRAGGRPARRRAARAGRGDPRGRARALPRAGSAELDDRQLEAVEALTRGIVAKLLHDPTVELKDAAGTPRGERLADALRDLFELE